MPACRPWSFALPWVAVLLGTLAGCNGTGEVRDEPYADASPASDDVTHRVDPPVYTDDLGEPVAREPITASTVGETQMLKRRMLFEVRGGVSVPLPTYEDNDFTLGPLIGAKIELETVKNLFFGLSFDWSEQDVDNGVSSVVTDPEQLPGVTPDQLFELTNRYNILAVFDYDIVLVRDTIGKETPLLFRFGAGAGLTIIDGTEDPQVTFDIKTFYGFLFRPAIGLRWVFHPNILLFGEVSYDFVIPNDIYAESGGEDVRIDGNVDFGTLNLIVGIGFQF
jgi:hypothetical protein